MKVEITKAQLQALMSITDECSAMIGCGNREDDLARGKWVRLADRFFNNNGFNRDFN